MRWVWICANSRTDDPPAALIAAPTPVELASALNWISRPTDGSASPAIVASDAERAAPPAKAPAASASSRTRLASAVRRRACAILDIPSPSGEPLDVPGDHVH